MYKTKLSLYNTDETIDRRLIIKATENTIRFLGLNKDIYYTMDDLEYIDREKNKLGKMESYSSPRSEYVRVEFEKEISDGYDVSLRMLRPNSYPIYSDSDINTKAIPVNTSMRYTVSFEYINKSKSMVTNLVNKLKQLPSAEGQYIVNHFDYYYILPNYLFRFLLNVNDIKNSVNGTTTDIETYINEHFDNRVDTINPVDGDSYKVDVVIRELQKNVISKITTNLAEIKKDKIDDESSWSVKFDFVFDIEVPSTVILYYPLTIYNRPIDETFRTFIKYDEYDFKGTDLLGDDGIRDIGVRSEFLDTVNNVDKPYIVIPKEDTVILPNPKPYMVRLVSVMSIVDPNDPTLLFNINDIPIIQFKQNILDFFKESEYPYIGSYYKSLFYFELYKNDKLNDSNVIVMDSNLNLRTSLPMDPIYTYRLTINVLVDLNILQDTDLERIEEYVATKNSNIMDYYSELLSIPNSELLYNRKDKVINPMITNNLWNIMKTKQIHTVYTSIFEEKEA